MLSQQKILLLVAAIVVVVAAFAIYNWRQSATMSATETPILGTPTTVPVPPANPAMAVSNTTFDIISPSSIAPSGTASESMPGSSGY